MICMTSPFEVGARKIDKIAQCVDEAESDQIMHTGLRTGDGGGFGYQELVVVRQRHGRAWIR